MRQAEAEPERRRRVLSAAAQLRAGLATLGLRVLGHGPIVPWVIGEPGAAVRVAGALRELGLDVRAIRPPSVAPGTSRLRLTVTAAHRSADVEHALAVIADVVRRGV
jgi:7-keto-8-aminopelargonate synthetase-like enzyme